MSSKPLCIYHHNCADGFGAAWVVWKFFKGEVDFVPGEYGKAPPNCLNRNVIIVDFSYKRDVMEAMAELSTSILVIDHHKTAQADLQPLLDSGKVKGVFDMDHSGAMLTWMWFYPNQEPPQLLKHIEDRDLWRFALPYTREIQDNLFSYPYNFAAWDHFMERLEDPEAMNEFILQGESIGRKHRKDIGELLTASVRPMIIGGYMVEVANLPYTMASDAAGRIAEACTFGATYFDTSDNRCFSLRSKGDFDVSEIAKLYGGGGHKNAAGFMMPLGWEGDTHLRNHG